MNGINELMTLFYGWIYLFYSKGMRLENPSVLDVPTACVNTWKTPSITLAPHKIVCKHTCRFSNRKAQWI